jgi:hypothetical protein
MPVGETERKSGYEKRSMVVSPKRTAVRKPKRKSPGRKPKITGELKTRLFVALRMGNPLETACTAVGIPSRTFRIYRAKAQRGEPYYVAFFDELEAAMADAKVRLLAQLRINGAKDWRAQLAILERIDAKNFGLKQQVTVDVKQEARDVLAEAKKDLAPGEYAKFLQVIVSKAGPVGTGEG